MTTSNGSARVVAHANIALAKYWGKSDVTRNLPAVPSLSLTLGGLRTVTQVTIDPTLSSDTAVLDGAATTGRALARITELLARVRKLAGETAPARVESSNEFPTAAGLASSASGFAALALAAVHAYGLTLEPAAVSALARASSASAARSVFGGFVTLGAGAEAAAPLAGPEHWPLVMLVAVTVPGPKSIGSTDGMQHTAATSPYYRAWLEAAPELFAAAQHAVLTRDLNALGAAMEQSTLLMHASMLGARPAVIYLAPATLAVMAAVTELRQRGVPAFYTMDAGPHVKVLTLPEYAAEVEHTLTSHPAVSGVIRCTPGPDAKVVSEGRA